MLYFNPEFFSGMVFRLAFSPCLAETLTVAIASHFLLNFPWMWGFMLGFVLAAVSPAVVVPCLLSLQERGYGVDKGIPTLVIAAASVDDVLAISGFTILLGITFKPEQDLLTVILQGPKEALIGLLFGVGWARGDASAGCGSAGWSGASAYVSALRLRIGAHPARMYERRAQRLNGVV